MNKQDKPKILIIWLYEEKNIIIENHYVKSMIFDLSIKIENIFMKKIRKDFTEGEEQEINASIIEDIIIEILNKFKNTLSIKDCEAIFTSFNLKNPKEISYSDCHKQYIYRIIAMNCIHNHILSEYTELFINYNEKLADYYDSI
jgi:hypothetical protein